MTESFSELYFVYNRVMWVFTTHLLLLLIIIIINIHL